MKIEKEKSDGKLKVCMAAELDEIVIDPQCAQRVVIRADSGIQTQKLVQLTATPLIGKTE